MGKRARAKANGQAPLQCGACTVCCVVHVIRETNKPGWTPCPHLGPVPELGHDGCTIYEERPEVCRNFRCTWLRGKMGREARFRPNNFGLVVSGNSEDGMMHITEVWPGAASGEAGVWTRLQMDGAKRGVIQPVCFIPHPRSQITRNREKTHGEAP